MNKLLKGLGLSHRHKFEAIRTIWPYPHGYGIYCKGCGTLLDAGLKTKEEAAANAYNENQNEILRH